MAKINVALHLTKLWLKKVTTTTTTTTTTTAAAASSVLIIISETVWGQKCGGGCYLLGTACPA